MGKRSAQEKLEKLAKLEKKVKRLQKKLEVNLKDGPSSDKAIAEGEESNSLRDEALDPETFEDDKVNESSSLQEGIEVQVNMSSDSESSDVSENLPPTFKIEQETKTAEEIPPAPQLSKDILQVLRANANPPKEEVIFHPRSVECWGKIIQDGLKKEDRVELLEKYPRKGNCKIETPIINEEVDSIINDKMWKRDNLFALDQNICGSGLSALGTAISLILNENEEGIDKLKILELLNDAGWLLSVLFHLLTVTRRSFLFSNMGRKMKAILEKNKVDDWLFGAELSQKIKAAQVAETVGSTLRFQPTQKKVFFHHSGNWRAPPAELSQQSRLRAGSSLRWSQHQPQRFKFQGKRAYQPSAQNQSQPQFRRSRQPEYQSRK